MRPTWTAAAADCGALTAVSSRTVPGGMGIPSDGSAWPAGAVSLLEMPTSILDEVVDIEENPGVNETGMLPVPSSRGTLKLDPSVETSSPPSTPSITALKLLLM